MQIAQVRVVARWGVRPEMPIVAGARNAAQAAQPLNVRVVVGSKPCGSGGAHRLDDRVEVGATPLGRRRVPEPQGFAKKIEVGLLAPDRALEFGDARLRLSQFVAWPRRGPARCPARTARRAMRGPGDELVNLCLPGFGPRLRFNPATPSLR